MTNKFLLEIGTEEIPARFIDNTLDQLKDEFQKLFNDERISYDSIKTYATPRRLVVLVSDIIEKQEDLEELVKGPSKAIAYDKEGNATKALEGFARGQGVEVKDIVIKEYNGEDYVYAHKVLKGKESKIVIKDNLSQIIKSIGFPKSMVWGGKDLKFARPIRWIVSLFNNEVVEFSLEGINSSNITKGHRFLGSSSISINSIDNYFSILEDNYVIVDQNKRKEIIKNGCDKLAKEKGGYIVEDTELLHELTYIVEYPTPLIGRIKEEFLILPKEVITTPMKEHQRYYPVVNEEGNLLPYFIAVRNGNEEYLDIVTKGNEKVIDARLEDAKFFYNEDTENELEEYVDSLNNIVFQEKLGTIYEKTNRIISLAENISEYLKLGDETSKNINRAGYLCKADLVTKMVGEFSELQGVMGREYAKASGENEIVSLAIYEHYLPRFSDDELPTTTAGTILSITDKLDTICGCFAINIQPTGSQDPYGLRRQAIGIINIILDKNLHISLNKIVDFALTIYKEEKGLQFDYNEVKNQIIDFFYARIRNMFTEKGIRYDVVDAVIYTNTDNITDLLVRAEELNKWINKEELNEILEAFNRVAKMANKTEDANVSRTLLQEEEEKELFDIFRDVDKKVQQLLKSKEYDKALDELIKLKEPIDNFFDNVMVMVNNKELKQNRLGLIKNISNTMLSICDMSKIVS